MPWAKKVFFLFFSILTFRTTMPTAVERTAITANIPPTIIRQVVADLGGAIFIRECSKESHDPTGRNLSSNERKSNTELHSWNLAKVKPFTIR